MRRTEGPGRSLTKSFQADSTAVHFNISPQKAAECGLAALSPNFKARSTLRTRLRSDKRWARVSLTSERRRNRSSRGFTAVVFGSDRDRERRHESDGQFEDGSRVEELAKPKPANSVRLPVRGHRSDFGFGALVLFHLLPRLPSSCSPRSLLLSFLKELLVDILVWNMTADLAFSGCLWQNLKLPALLQISSR